IVTVGNVTRAEVADGGADDHVRIRADGAVSLIAQAAEYVDTRVTAGAGASTAGVGAGAAGYVLDTDTRARLGDYAEVAGYQQASRALLVDARDSTRLNTVAGGAGGGGVNGDGAAAAVAHLTQSVRAEIGQGSRVEVENGWVKVSAAADEQI